MYVCLSVKSHLTSGGSVHPENSVMYSVDNGSQKICKVFSETALLQKSSTALLKAYVRSAIFLRKVLMRIISISAIVCAFSRVHTRVAQRVTCMYMDGTDMPISLNKCNGSSRTRML